MSLYDKIRIKLPKKRDPEGGRHRSGSGPHSDKRKKRKRTRQAELKHYMKEFE